MDPSNWIKIVCITHLLLSLSCSRASHCSWGTIYARQHGLRDLTPPFSSLISPCPPPHSHGPVTWTRVLSHSGWHGLHLLHKMLSPQCLPVGLSPSQNSVVASASHRCLPVWIRSSKTCIFSTTHTGLSLAVLRISQTGTLHNLLFVPLPMPATMSVTCRYWLKKLMCEWIFDVIIKLTLFY